VNRVEEIEAAISNLAPEEYRQIARWFREREQASWDRQFDDDSFAGKIDFLFEEAENEGQDGSLRDWPAAR
jgi:hypothetical protein